MYVYVHLPPKHLHNSILAAYPLLSISAFWTTRIVTSFKVEGHAFSPTSAKCACVELLSPSSVQLCMRTIAFFHVAKVQNCWKRRLDSKRDFYSGCRVIVRLLATYTKYSIGSTHNTYMCALVTHRSLLSEVNAGE